MLSQTGYGQYFMQQGVREDVADSINNYFAQLTWNAEPVTDEELFAQTETTLGDEDLEDVATYLMQLTLEETERLQEFIQIEGRKKKN